MSTDNPWIPVDDERRPEPLKEAVLLYGHARRNGQFANFVHVGYYHADLTYQQGWGFDRGSGPREGRVTYWMPIPEPIK